VADEGLLTGLEEDKGVIDDAAQASVAGCLPDHRLLDWELHIVHSDVWQCPVLYFRVAHTDGTPLHCDAVWELLEALQSPDVRQQSRSVLLGSTGGHITMAGRGASRGRLTPGGQC
jgi:hypothetical protein